MRLRIIEAGQLCFRVRVTLPILEDLPISEFKFDSLVYQVPLAELLIKDRSSLHSTSQFLSLWRRLIHSTTVQCTMLGTLPALRARLGRTLEEAVFEETPNVFRLAGQSVSLQGERVAVCISGVLLGESYSSVRFEARSSSAALVQDCEALLTALADESLEAV